jgi:hypothetical protein
VRDLDEHELRQRLYGYLGPSRGPGPANADARVVADALEAAVTSGADVATATATAGGAGREDGAEAKSAAGPLS